jgi:hypothetical protein
MTKTLRSGTERRTGISRYHNKAFHAAIRDSDRSFSLIWEDNMHVQSSLRYLGTWFNVLMLSRQFT